ncbi:MAG: ABC transporter permease [Elusimicrobia bacterium]|nr:ABC transporter permease [Elusimicrobiota bacterium]
MPETPELIIEKKSGWKAIDCEELWRYRDLFFFLVWRDVKVGYKQTVLGFGWAIIRPLVSMVVFSVIFGRLAKMPSDGAPYPVFAFTALLPWLYFSSAMSNSTASLLSNANTLSKVYFPRLIIPMTPVLVKLIDLAITSVILGFLMLWFGVQPTAGIVMLPYLVFLMVLTTAGVGMWLSVLAVQYRDVNYATSFIIQILMYVTPVAWPLSLVPRPYRLWYGLYPMAGVIEGFRSALLGTVAMPWDLILMGSLSAFLLFATGALYFKRMEGIFADIV